MSLTTEQQISNALEKSQRPLITFRKNFSGDSLASALALFLLLEKMKKNAIVAADNFILPPGYKFLPAHDKIKNKLATPRQMIISLDASKTNVEEFHYDVVDDQLKIYISPRGGFFGPQDVKASVSEWRYDLILIVDTPDLESLGTIYTHNRELFYERPIINIDCSPANENFGQINLIDLTSSSTAGVLYNLIKAWDENLFDPDINTCLLTGIIDKTKSFKAGMINPQTLQMSSRLIEKKARREEIIKNLYYNRDLATLKLWGKVLTQLREHFNGKLVSATISSEDFQQTNTSTQNLPDIIDELISTIPSVDLIVLLYQKENNQIGVLVKSLSFFDALKSLQSFEPQGDKNLIKFSLPDQDLISAEQKVIEEIKKSYKPAFWIIPPK